MSKSTAICEQIIDIYLDGDRVVGEVLCDRPTVIETPDFGWICLDCALGLAKEGLFPQDVALVLEVLES